MSPTSYQAAPPRIASVAEQPLGVKLPAKIPSLSAAARCRRSCCSGYWRGGLLDQHGPARKGIVSRNVINNIDLTGIKTGFQGLQRQVQLKLDRSALRHVDFRDRKSTRLNSSH